MKVIAALSLMLAVASTEIQVSGAEGNDGICDRDNKYLEACLQELPRVYPGIPSTMAEVDSRCKAFKKGMSCVDEYSARCLSGDSRKVLKANVAGARHAFSYLCDDPIYLNNYLQYSGCYKAVSGNWNFCANTYMRAVNPSSRNTTHTKALEICCSKYSFVTCVRDMSNKKCGEDAARFLIQLAETLSNIRVYDDFCQIEVAQTQLQTPSYCSSASCRLSCIIIVLSFIFHVVKIQQ